MPFSCVPSTSSCDPLLRVNRSYPARSRYAEGGSCPREGVCKEWDPEFTHERKFKEDHSHVEHVRQILPRTEGIAPFFHEDDHLVPPCIIKEVSQFCQHAEVSKLKSAVSDQRPAEEEGFVWMDDRCKRHLENCECSGIVNYTENSGCVRRYKNPLSASELYGYLKMKRFNVPGKPDAERRLIYIANPSPYHILALIETVPYHQASALRSAIWGYLARQTSIRATAKGFKIFHLEFQVPYFAFRKSPHPNGNSQKKVNGKSWIDLSFLQMHSAGLDECGIYDSRMTLVICGGDDSRWVAYGLDDAYYDDDEADDDGSNEEKDEDDVEDEPDPYLGFRGDPIASKDDQLDSNKPLWNPRLYFLSICNIRMAQIRNEWQNLLRELELRITSSSNQCSPNLSEQPGCRGQLQNIHKALDRAVRTIKILGLLQNRLSGTIKAWDEFNSCKGDIGYFDFKSVDQSSRLALSTIGDILENFRTLESFERQLHLLKEIARDSADALNLYLTLESSKAAQQSNKVALRRIEVAEKTHEMALENHKVARKSHEVAERNVDIARQNAFSAELTSSINCSIALTAVYFSLPEAVIPFTRNIRSLIVSIFICIVVLKLCFNVFGILLRPSRWKEKTSGWVMFAKTLLLRYPRNILHNRNIEASERDLEVGEIDIADIRLV